MKQPILFFGHGNPMLAIEDNPYTPSWQNLGARLPRPKAILMISAHWVTRGTWLTAMKEPSTIHDFGGFPKALFDEQYPAPGSPELAEMVKELLAPTVVTLEENEWGLDHGAWTVLKHLFPLADIPVVQLSLDASLSSQEHYELAKKLSSLREQGILIVGSGNVVHNLQMVDFSSSSVFPWAQRFNEYFKEHLIAGDDQALIDPFDHHPDARISHPTLEHYWPALYILALREADDSLEIITDGIDLASISMLSFKLA